MKKLISLVFLCLSSLALMAQPEGLTQSIDKLANQCLDYNLFSGTVLVASKGEVVYHKAFGHADKDYQIPNTLETRYNIGSIGKTFTSVAVMQLAQKGLLKLDDPVKKHLSDFPHSEAIQVGHLLSHTSGLNNYMIHPDFQGQKHRLRKVADFKPLIYSQPLLEQAPGVFHYSNSGMVLAGAVVEQVSGMAYADYIRKHIFEPLGMKHTGIIFREQVVPHRSTGYTIGVDGSVLNNVFDEPPAAPDGGIYTTTGDMLLFDRALYGTTLLSEASKAQMFSPHCPEGNYGYGWELGQVEGSKLISHGGGAPGVSAQFSRYVDKDLTLIVLSNYSGGARLADLIAATLQGKVPPPISEPVARVIYRFLEGHPAAELPAYLKSQGLAVRHPGQLNNAGYELMAAGKLKQALAFFKFNVELFPDDSNVYDSLGEAYLANGQKAEALTNYKKALAMDPNNVNARQIVQQLEAK